jgi:hypothetical protein
VADFRQFDLNRDGIVTVSECKRATEAGAVLGSPSATLVASASPGPGRYSSTGGSSSSTSRGASGSTTSSAAGSTTESSGTSSVSARYVKYAVGYIKRYDDDKNGVLTEQEWKKMSRDYSAADKDKDGKITPVELAEAMMKR